MQLVIRYNRSMKKKNDKLEPISHITKSEASYERLVLELLNTLVL